MTISLDTSTLLSYYQSRTGAAGSGFAGSSVATKKVAPTPPWNSTGPAATASLSKSVKDAMAGRRYIDEGAAQLDLAGASADYRKMFALYQGLSTLSGVAEGINAKGLLSFDKTRIQRAFERGMAEVAAYVDIVKLEKLRLAEGEVSTIAKSTLGAPKIKTEYVTTPLVSGSSSNTVDAFAGDVKFDIAVKRTTSTFNVSIDFAEMGAQPRNLGNVINFINQKLQDAGVMTRVGSQRIPAEPRTITVNGKAVAMPPGPDQWALKIKVDTLESVSFSAPVSAPSVYVAQSVGNPDPDGKAATNDGVTQRQLLKFQTDVSQVPSPPQIPGEANWVAGRVFAENLDSNIETVRATATGPDGSVYMLADVTGKTNGQAIKGERDVALIKYDSAGNLVYSRTLGAADDAKGLALAVSADGQVAVAGSVTGVLGGAVDGPMNSNATASAFADRTDSFVTLYDAQGQEVWTQRRGARQEDEASELSFGADGTVYVAGRAKSAMPGTTALGGWDTYIEAFKADVTGKVSTLFTQAFGTAGNDKPSGMVIDGTNMVTASVENGRAVLRRFDLSGGAPVLTSTRDLGDLQGGDIAGLSLDGGQVVIAGTTRNAGLSAGAVTRAHAGGSDAFAARISADLSVSGSDRIAYYGGTGDDTATALAVSGGKVYIAGSVGTDLPGEAPVGKKDGFLTELNVDTGAIDWSRRFTGKDGYAAPSAIAVDAQGSSVLDRLGLPKGKLDMTTSGQVTALSSIRAGDQFTVKVGEGSAKTVTIEAKDTLDTLAQKIRRAMGFQGKVDIVTTSGVRYLQIKPLNDRSVIEIGAGKTDKNALEFLGIPEGVVRNTITKNGKIVPADGKAGIYGLGLPSNLNLSNPEQVNHALAEISGAMGVIRTAYKDLVAAASPKSAQQAAAAAGGKVPTYLTNQIANYQAALDRLTGGG